jgi:hypothetical protein
VYLVPVIDTDKIKAGMIATILLKGEHKMNKRGNPLLGRVTRDHRLVVTVAGPKSYTNRLEKRGDEPAGKAPWYKWVKDGVVVHPESGKMYLAALPTGAQRHTRYLVDGREATAEELQIIRQFTPEKGDPDILCFAMESVDNVQ